MEPPSIEGYEVLELAGRGGSGSVWRALYLPREQDVAIKVFHSLRSSPAGSATFQREVEALARMDHPGVVRLLDAGRDLRGVPFLAMEWVDGGTLARHAVGDWRELRQILLALLVALGHAHARLVLHRDIKPGNVLLERRGGSVHPRLADFGISAVAESRAAGFCGTPLYMAPEQLEGRHDDEGPWTDLYALGCLAFELATGTRPFDAGSVAALTELHRGAPRPTLTARFEVPDGLAAWIDRLLAVNWQERFFGAGDARRALELLEPGRASSVAPSHTLTGATTGPPLGVRLMARAEPPLLGRGDAVRTLLAEASAVVEHGSARRAHVRGPRGAGISRLAAWVAESLEQRGWLTLHVDGNASEGLADALGRALRLPRTRSREGCLERLRMLGLDAGGHGARAAWQLLDGASGALGEWALRTVIREIASHRPVLVWLDGIDGPGEALEGALSELRGFGEVRALLIGSGAGGPGSAVDRVIEIEDLDEATMIRCLRTVAPLDTDSLREIVEASGGRPGQALATLRQLLRSGAARPNGAFLHLDRSLVGSDASTLDALVARRVRSTMARAADARALSDALFSLAVRGSGACPWPDLDRVLVALGHDPSPAWADLAIEDGWLDSRGGAARLESRTDQEALERIAIASGDAPRLHRAWLRALPDAPVEARAQHALFAGELEACVVALERAADRARESGLGAVVAAIARRCEAALDLGSGDLRFRCGAVIVAGALAAGDLDGGEDALNSLREQAEKDSRHRWRLLWLEAVCDQLRGRVQRARERFARAAADTPDLGARGRCYHGVAECAKLVGDLEIADHAYREALAVYRAHDSRHAIGRALVGLGDNLRRQGRFDEARWALGEAMEHLEGATLAEGIAANSLGDVERAADNLGAAVEWYEVALDKVASGASYDAAFVHLNLGLVHLAAGEHGRAHEAASRARALFRANRQTAYEAHVDAIDLAVALARGDRARSTSLRARLEPRLGDGWSAEADLRWVLSLCDALEARGTPPARAAGSGLASTIDVSEEE